MPNESEKVARIILSYTGDVKDKPEAGRLGSSHDMIKFY